MTLLNVSFGIFALMPQGWLFMIFVILIECFIISKILSHNWKNFRIYISTFVSNLISGIIGFIISMILNGGWWLVVWFPWISNNEVYISFEKNAHGFEHLLMLIIYYVCAFLLSVLIENLINWLILRKKYETKSIIISTLKANIVSYLIGSGLLYLYSFNF